MLLMIKKELLLHVCCGPCSLNVIDELKDEYSLFLYFYNPNIYPHEEYIKRRDIIKDYASSINLPFFEDDYDIETFYNIVKDYETEPEKGKRCELCYNIRLLKTLNKARELGIKIISTTLSISPRKNSKMLFLLAENIEKDGNIIFLKKDFKKNDGFKKTMEKARKLGFYIQNYCGCIYSIRPKVNSYNKN
jgi:hypothetical protein